MNSRNNILEELSEINADASMLPIAMPYQVPENFFNTVADVAKANIFLASISAEAQKQPFYLPENYFVTFENHLMQRLHKEIVSEELNELSPLLAAVKKESTYIVPEAYFNTLKTSIPEKDTKGKLISFAPIRNIYKMAIAASLVGIIAMVAYTFTKQNNVGNTYAANITQAVIDEKVQKISDQEIQEYLSKQDVISLVTSSSIEAENNVDNNNFFELMSDEEISQYLQAHPDTNEKNIKGI